MTDDRETDRDDLVATDDAVARYVQRKYAEHREYLEMARRAATEAQAASDRARSLRAQGRGPAESTAAASGYEPANLDGAGASRVLPSAQPAGASSAQDSVSYRARPGGG